MIQGWYRGPETRQWPSCHSPACAQGYKSFKSVARLQRKLVPEYHAPPPLLEEKRQGWFRSKLEIPYERCRKRVDHLHAWRPPRLPRPHARLRAEPKSSRPVVQVRKSIRESLARSHEAVRTDSRGRTEPCPWHTCELCNSSGMIPIAVFEGIRTRTRKSAWQGLGESVYAL